MSDPHDPFRRLRALEAAELDALAADIRADLVTVVSRTGGHLGPNLGVVEITIALHRVFRSGTDRFVFDTGHQAYVHKMLTGRADRLGTLRQAGGLSGYPNRAESPHDVVENSHASTALAYADGLAKAAALTGDPSWVVVVVGDGALTGGIAWEALNNLGAARHPRVVVVLNDNGRSYAPTVGGVADHLAALRAAGAAGAAADATGTADAARDRATPRTVFECLGLRYAGPVDGHDRDAVERALDAARRDGGTTVVHCLTRKGAGHGPAERDDLDGYHAVRGLDGNGARVTHTAPTWTDVFGQSLLRAATTRRDVVAVTAAMTEPTGLAPLAAAMPDRVFDVGIAEQHAVTSAAGLAMGGLHPVVAVYSTFLNRAFDQVLLDAALHHLPVTLVLDRAGVTGPDGPSHHGMWDLSLLQMVPGLAIAAPRDAPNLRAEFEEALAVGDAVTVLHFPSGPVGESIPAVGGVEGVDVLRAAGDRPDVLLVAVGAMAPACLAAAETAARSGLDVAVVDPRWVCPVDPGMVELSAASGAVVTVEDGVVTGGVGSALAQELSRWRIATPVRALGLPRRFLPHGSRADLLGAHGLTGEGIAAALLRTAAVRRPGLARRAALELVR